MKHSRFFLFIALATGIMCSFFLSSSLTSCNTKKCPVCDTTVKTTAALAPMGTHFYELSLSKNDYENNLKTYHGGDTKKLVFQFYFNSENANSPSLIAYSSKKKNEFVKGGATKSVILTITATQGLAVPNVFVLGDQQALIADIDNLIAGAGNPADYTLIFKPKQSGLNIYYAICVKNNATGVEFCGGDPGTNTQPSPPADAN